MANMKLFSWTVYVSVITVISVNCGNLPHGYEVRDSTDGLVSGVDSEDQAKLMNLIFPDGDEQLNEEENGSNAGELESSPNTTTSKPSTSCEMNGGECLSKKNKKTCQGTINKGYKCSKKDVCCMPGALELLLQSIKDDIKSIKDDLSDLGSDIGIKSEKLTAQLHDLQSNQDVLIGDVTDLGSDIGINRDNMVAQLQSLKGDITDLGSDIGIRSENLTAQLQDLQSNQDVLIGDVTDLGSTHCPKGFFMSSGRSRQCFKYFDDKYRNWTLSVSKCQAEGLVLAEPYDPVAVRAYIVTRYGGSRYTWINGRGTGSYIQLQRSGAYVYSGNAYWYPGNPGSKTSSSYCLLLLTAYVHLKSHPNQPFSSGLCTSWIHTLCELVIE